jgi:preprotein translocase subunit SecA
MAVTETLGKAFTRIFKTSSERYVRKRTDFVEQVNALEPEFGLLEDDQLLEKSLELRQRIADRVEEVIGGDLREHLKELNLMPEEARKPARAHLTEQLQACCDPVLCEAFALVREASDRHLGIRSVFDDKLNFDASILSKEMRSVYDDARDRVAKGENVHHIPLVPEFYAEIRKRYDANDRPPFRFRHFDVQLIGGNVLYEGTISEMATGEGKTLVATLAAYLVAISGRKVHVITVNDYLAKRDRDWMAPVFEALGLSVGAIQSDMDSAGDERQEQYDCDITYGTNNEFGFDYLRDNMKVSVEDQVQGPLDYAIIDEVDSILIDEARTPLIISGPAADDTERYKKADKVAREIIKKQREYNNIAKQIDQHKRLIANAQGETSDAKKVKDSKRVGHAGKQLEESLAQIEKLEAKKEQTTQYYEVEYDRHSVHLTHEGIGVAQELAGVGSFFVGANMEWPHLMEQALRGHVIYEREKDYVVQDGEVIIVDEFTGRLMVGRQWSDGLHQAVEAKENVTVKQESQTLATITIQNFFKLYQQLAGMTGTAMTEADEFMKIYNLNVINIPTNKPIVRDDREDMIFKTETEKFNAIVDEIQEASKAGQPVLIGTLSIEKSEALSEALTKRYGLDHEVLNAKQHAREATIVAKAGFQHQGRDGKMWGNVTIATNMAGRGTDIKLGQGVVEAGGLYVLGTERHEARRIDNQLRGRAGRQGDPGTSQFFLCFEDDLMRIFAPEWTVKALSMIGWDEGEPIYHGRISKGVEKAQKKVEQRNFESRKSLLEYDEVMDYQRQVFYTRRQSILEGRGLEGLIWDMVDDVIAECCGNMLSDNYPYECIIEWVRTAMRVDIELDRIRGNDVDEIEKILRDHARNNAEQEISVTLGEYMGDDLEESDWDFKGLSKWAMSAFEVNVSQNQLRKMTFIDVQDMLVESASARIEKHDLSKMSSFLTDDYGKSNLCDFVNQKYNLEVKPEELPDKEKNAIEEYLRQRARDAYRKREIEYPVDFILNVSLRQQQSGSGYAAKLVSDWVKRKYNQDITIDDIQNTSYDKMRTRLVELSESYFNGKLSAELDDTLRRHSWDDRGRDKLAEWAKERFDLALEPDELDEESGRETIETGAKQFLRHELTELERFVLLQIYDSTWKDHLYSMDHLKSSIGLRGFAEKDPRIEYKKEGFRMFQEMLSNIRNKVTDIIFKAQLDQTGEMRSVWNISNTMHADYERFSAQQAAAQNPQGEIPVAKTIKRDQPKVGRNDPCPCGSGKKYKKCHGANA